MSERALCDDERLDWIRLALSENVGPATFRLVIQRWGSPKPALDALPELGRRGGLTRTLRICSAGEAEAHMDRAKEAGATFVTWDEPGYPPLLRHIDGAPPFLTIKGDASLASRKGLAIVGARNASAVGRKFSRRLAAELGAAGYMIVSGLARGIDTAAHEGALSTGTAGVLAGGIDVIYPPENEQLYGKIGESGLLLSEMVPGTVPRGINFPRRNRIISGACLAVIVVEAALRSGSLITARLAGEQGRDVFAVPGSPLDPRAEGTNKLIREGAVLLTSSDDVLQALGSVSPLRPATEFRDPPLIEFEASSTERDRIIGLLSPSPIEIDDLIRESAASPPAVLGVILELELAGRAVRHRDQRVSLA